MPERRSDHEAMVGKTIVIQPLEIPAGPYFGRLTLSVFGRHMPMGELPRDLATTNKVWRLIASIDRRDSITRVDPARQIGNLLVASSVEGVGEVCDEWVNELTDPYAYEHGTLVACTVLGRTEQHPLPDRPYADFIRRYDIERTGIV